MSVLKKTKRGNINYELCEGSYGLELWVIYDEPCFCGNVAHAENLEYAIDMHEEEMSILVEQARVEFGF